MTEETEVVAEEAVEPVEETAAKKKPTKLRIIATALAVVVAAFAILEVASIAFTPYPWQERTPNESIRDYSVLFEPDNTLDVLVFGDSEAYSAYSPLRMYEHSGFTSFTCSVGAQLVSRSDVLLEQVLTRQKPKVVLVETSQLYAEIGKVDLLKAELVKVLPIFEYHDRWKAFLPFGGNRSVGKWWGESHKGFRTSDEVVPAQDGVIKYHNSETSEVEEVPALNKQVLAHMVDDCRQRGIEIMLISTPSTTAMDSKRHNGLTQVAAELGIDYLDLNYGPNKMDIDWKKETRDEGGHVNKHGAKRISNFLAGYLDKKYDLPDHRGEADYESWNAELEKYLSHFGSKEGSHR